MKVLFLDIDGVLNSIGWAKRRVRPPTFGQMPTWQKLSEDCLDPDAIERLNRIVERTGCAVVLSSTWRKGEPLTRMTRMLRYRGFRHRLFGATPHLCDETDTGSIINRQRGCEIQEWLRMSQGAVTAYAVLDDDSDMDGCWLHFVQTDWEGDGLSDEDVEACVALLGEVSK